MKTACSECGKIYSCKCPIKLDKLAPRQKQIAEMWLQGFSASVIAKRLNLKRSTVTNVMSKVYKKHSISTRKELEERFYATTVG